MGGRTQWARLRYFDRGGGKNCFPYQSRVSPSTADTPLNKFLWFLRRGFNYLIVFFGIDFPKKTFRANKRLPRTLKQHRKLSAIGFGFVSISCLEKNLRRINYATKRKYPSLFAVQTEEAKSRTQRVFPCFREMTFPVFEERLNTSPLNWKAMMQIHSSKLHFVASSC